MFRRLYDWTLKQAGRRNAVPVLGAVSFAESSVFPIPPDVLLIPMVVAAPDRAWRIATVCTVASVAGALLGYAIGMFLFEAVGRPIFEAYGAMGDFEAFQTAFAEWGWWIVAGAGFTPFPFKVITIASGAVSLDPVVFILASILSRGGRFFLVAAILWKFGPPVRDLVERHFAAATIAFFALLIGGFVAIRYVV